MALTKISGDVIEDGIVISGIITATSFSGDGSALTGVVGSGSGVVIRDSGSPVGTAGTIDFGSNLSVSPIFAGIVTVTGTDTNTTYTQAAVASGSNVNIRLSGSDSTTDDILLTAGSNVTFSSVTASGFTINSSGSGGGGESYWAETSAGIHTLSNVGVGTTNPTSKLAVTGDANITGVVTATSFSGSGSGLTNLQSGQLTGALPALDGSALTGVIGSGSGVVIRDSGSPVGTAGTIDFGDNLTVSPISAGIVTVTATGGGGSSQFVTTSVGIHTLSNVGIGTTNPTSKLTVTGDVLVTGVVTATTFVGALTGTASNVTTNANLTGDVTSTGNATSIAAGVIVDADINASATIALSKLATTGTLTATSFVGTAATTFYISEWILGANGTSDYTFTGPGLIGAENDPTLYLIRGQRYEFTNTMGAHPFRIQSTVNGSTGTQYNDGVVNNDVSNGTLTWDVQFDAPNLLYYQCTAHPDMGGKIYILNSEDNVSAGTTSAPSISPSGDSNTGIFFPSADTIAFAEGGSEAMRIDSSSRLLIGTSTAPSAGNAQYSKLVVQGNTFATTDYGILNLQRGLPASGGITGNLGGIHFSDNTGNEFGLIQCAADGTTSAGDYPGNLKFSTTADGASSPTERMRIDNQGRIGFNYAGVNGVINDWGYGGYRGISANTNSTTFADQRASWFLRGSLQSTNSEGGNCILLLQDTGGAAISPGDLIKGYSGTTFNFRVANNGGVTNTPNTYGAISDERLKQDIEDAQSQWDDIKQIQVRKFRFRNAPESAPYIGVIAQELEAVSPGLIDQTFLEDGSPDPDSYKSVKYSVLYMKAIKALQEAMERIEQLEAKVAALENTSPNP